ncbi:protein phosphatase 2C domain-containing protein [Streptomyces sp. ISL-22]|uniref:protein phosphatase 2C domain-containing protein n=1 Tax=unclassified Streptomyces TaxID=2593676 RepID=UPI001BEA9A0A|nr:MULTISPECIES: protein phosphatase 2C domain-containing protein [unclassified Streptomyces]MBT2422692.1 protein phosphatase 2C domain-containing protein [Streptomyces sp. ISL-24]MBT2435945.1 protein phosphatase 2C domain-containing protein [Streptomyces sp. ISL-22]
MVTLGVRRWETIGDSVQGVNKQHNQDWYACEGSGGGDDPLVLAVADGHGSAVHARSGLGARFAVDRFVVRAAEFGRAARDCHERGRLARLMTYARDDFPRVLVHDWREAALGHWDRHRPVADEGAREPAPDEKLVLYGTTLIGAVLTPWLFVAWQIGDGDLAVVEHDGTLRRPLATGEEDLGDETESLCGSEAWRAVRTHWAPLFDEARTPRLVVLSTDGLSKSFASADGYREFVAGLDGRLMAEGSDGVRASLPQWLRQASRYSGDDTTLAAALRHVGLVAEDTPAMETERKTET